MFDTPYWYIYAGPVMRGQVFATAVAGPGDNAVPLDVTLTGDLKWVQSLDHRPTDAEIDAHIPEEWRDAVSPESTYGIRPHRYPHTAEGERQLKAAAEATPLLRRWP